MLYSQPASKSIIKSLVGSLALQELPELPSGASPSQPGCTYLLDLSQQTPFPVHKNKQTNQPALQLLPFICRKKEKKNLNSGLMFKVLYCATVDLASILKVVH